MDNTKEFRCVEWFFGYGGNHFGLKRVIRNLRLVAACEIEAYAIANMVSKMERGWLDPAPIWPDCRTFPAGPFKDRVHLFIASYPCQAESTAGKRGGENDPRYLWPFVRDFIKTARPLWVWCENVEGHLSSGFPNVYADLSDMGYRVEAGVFSALEVGASQQRKRIFFLAKLAESDGDGLSGFLREAGSWEDWAEFRADPYGESIGDDGYGASCEKEDVDDTNGCGLIEHEGCIETESDCDGKDNGLSGERGQDVAFAEDLHDGQVLPEKEYGQVQQSGECCIKGDMDNTHNGHPEQEGQEICTGRESFTATGEDFSSFREICVAPPGEEQYFWEAPRVVDGAKGKRPVNGVDDLRQTEGDGDEPGEPGSSDGQGGDVANTENEYDNRIGEPRGRGDGHPDEDEGGDRERSTEPGLGGAADADPGGLDRLRSDGVDLTSIRADRLRMSGNGVDPVTAAKAFVFLMRKHDESERIGRS